MNSSSKKTVPLLTKIIAGNGSDKIKKRALFVLSQSNQPQAYAVIAKLAEDSSNVSLQKYAIHTLGISGSQKAIPLLKQIYANTKNKDIKMDVLKGFMVSDNSDELLVLARKESDIDLKNRAINLLGVMGKSGDLLKIYQEKNFAEHRTQIIRGIAIGGGAEALFEIINSEKDERLLLNAIKSVGIISKHKTAEKLADLYNRNSNKEVRFAIIHALFIQSDAKGLVRLIEQEKDPELKRKILRNLSVMGSEESDEYFAKILESEG